jgi:predicted kinase
VKETAPLEPVLVIFSGLPGTGKTTLARRLAQTLSVQLFRLDDFVAFLPAGVLPEGDRFWEEIMAIMLRFVEAQLELGLSVIVDAVFMGPDRAAAAQIAARHGAAFRPIHTYVSDDAVWRARIETRARQAPAADAVATWARVQDQQRQFAPWAAGAALFVDAAAPLEANLARALRYLAGGDGR